MQELVVVITGKQIVNSLRGRNHRAGNQASAKLGQILCLITPYEYIIEGHISSFQKWENKFRS